MPKEISEMLKALLTKTEFAELNEGMQELYSGMEGSENYILKVTGVSGFELADVNGLKSALQKERTNRDDLEKKFKDLSNKTEGIEDFDAAKEALAKVQELADYDPEQKLKEAKEQFQKTLESKLSQEWEGKTGKLQQEIEGLNSKLQSREAQLGKTLIDTKASILLSKPDIKGNPNILLPKIREHVVVQENASGEYDVTVLDENRQPKITTKVGSMDNMNLEEFVRELKNDVDFASAFEGNQASGSGAGGGGGTKFSGTAKIIRSGSNNILRGDELERISEGDLAVEMD